MNPAARRDPALDAQSHKDMVKKEVAIRAALFYRLGFSADEACERILANVSWDFEVGCDGRPSWLSDSEVKALVDSTYARRPTL
jgi:hypothetical protein